MPIPALAAISLAAGLFATPPDAQTDASAASYRAHLAAAYAAYRLGEPDEAHRWLEAAPASERGWEWRHLASLFDQSLATTGPLAESVIAVELHPSLPLAAVALGSGPVLLWDIERNALVRELRGHEGGTFTTRFSPDGDTLASSGADRVARIWAVGTGELVREFKDHKFPVPAVIFTPDGTHAISAAYYVDKETPIHGRIHVWNLSSGAIERTFTGGRKPLSSLALSPDGKTLAAGSWDSCVFLWDFEQGGEPRRLDAQPKPGSSIHINAISFSPDGVHLAAASDEEWIRIYRLADGAVVANLADHHADVNAAAFSPDGSMLATGGDDGAVRLWRAGDWTLAATLCGHTAAVRSLDWSTDGARLCSGSLDRTVRLWDPRWKGYGGIRGSFGNTNYSVSFAPDGNAVACSTSAGTVGLLDTRTGAKLAEWEAHPGGETCTAVISPDGRQLASCSWDRTLRVWNIADHQEVASATLPAGIALVAWSPDGSLLAAALRDGSAVLVDAAKGTTMRTLGGHQGRVNTVTFSPDGTRLATSAGDGIVRVWDVASGESRATMRGHRGSVETCAFLPNGQQVVSGGGDGTVRLWDAASGQSLRTLLESDSAIYRVAVAPDGQRIAAGGEHAFLLDPDVAGPLLRFKPFASTVWDLEWSPDGDRLALGAWNGEVVILGCALARLGATP